MPECAWEAPKKLLYQRSLLAEALCLYLLGGVDWLGSDMASN